MANRSQILQRLWTHLETVENLRISPATLHQTNCKMTEPRTFPIGRHRRYNPSDVLELLRSGASTADDRRAEGRAP